VTLLALVRHGPTPWSAARRLQGRADPGLDAAGRAEVARWRLPDELAGLRWWTSPLTRARETAALLGLRAAVAPLLIEMDWGAWEGRTLAELRASDPAAMAAREAAGLDLRPPGGESPREVQERLRRFLAVVAASEAPTGAVTHKGVIRAVLALATDWDMTGKPPVRLRWDAAHLFRLGHDGRPSVERLNVGLRGAPEGAQQRGEGR
jgi:probable phosphoglycerate mutase